MKLKEFEKVQKLIKKYRELKILISDVKSYLKKNEGTFRIYGITSVFNEGFSLTKEETNMVLSRLENELIGLKNEIKELGVEIENDK